MSYKLVGYFENWAQYRQAGGKFFPQQIDPSLFTHINFAFGLFGFVTWSVDPKATRTGDQRYTGDYTIQPVEWNDQTVLYPALQKLKGANLKTLLSIGGWSINSGDDQPNPGNPHPYGPYTYRLFSQMAANAQGRTQFITSAIAYAQKYGFDGIDIDWEYPGYLSRGGTPDDLPNFLNLVREFRAKAPSGFLLTMAAPAIVPTGLPQQYHANPQSYFAWLAQCAAEFDWLNVMTYDFHGAFDPITGVNAPLAQDSVPNGPFSISNTVTAYLAAGIPKEKIVLGMPTYGRSFQVTGGLTNSDHGYGKPATAAAAGPATATPGVLSYYEITPQIASGALVRVWDDATLTPYAYSSQSGEWVTYDDSESLAYKTAFVNAMGLGGAMVWAIDDDDFGSGFPLIREIKKVLDDPSKGPKLPAGLIGGGSNDQVQSLADAIKNAQDLGNARTSALNVLFFVCAAEGNVDPTKYINNNKVDDGADPNDANVFHDAAYVFSQLNGGVPNDASEQKVLDRFRTALNWDLGNNTSAPNVASEWDNYLFADDPKGQGYLSVGYQLHFEQFGEQATKNLDNGVSRTATQYHYVGHFQYKSGTTRTGFEQGDGDTTAELWLEQPGNTPPATVNEGGVWYNLDKGSDGKPVSRQQQVQDISALNETVAQTFETAEQNYTPQYDNSGNLQNADPVTRLAQYTAQTQYHPQQTQAVPTNDPDATDRQGVSGISNTTSLPRTETTGPSLTHDNPGRSDRDAMQALLNLFGVTSGNYQDILNAAQANNPALAQQGVVAQVIEGFVPGGSLIGALVQYIVNAELLDWKKKETQQEGRGTFYIDMEESQNQQQLLTAGVQSIFDIATSIIGPPEGLVADVLRGLKNVVKKFEQAGSDFAEGAAHAAPKPEVPEPQPSSRGAAGSADNGGTSTTDKATFMSGEPVGSGTGGAIRAVKAADGSEFLMVRMADGSYSRVEPVVVNTTDYSYVRELEDGIPDGDGPLLWLDKSTPGRDAAYIQTADDTDYGLPGGARPAPTMPVPDRYAPELGLQNQAGTPYKPGSYGYGFANKPYVDMETDHFPPYGAYQGTPYAFVADTRMPAVNLPTSLHQFERDFGYAGNYATSTGRTRIATQYRSQLQDLMNNGQYGQAMITDLQDKINLIIYNRDHIPVEHQNLGAFKQALSDAVNYAHQTHLIDDADLGQAMNLIFGGMMDQWRTGP